MLDKCDECWGLGGRELRFVAGCLACGVCLATGSRLSGLGAHQDLRAVCL
jgi:hypothetical protein